MGTSWTLQWRHNGHDGVWNHQRRHCLLNRVFRRRSKKTPKLRITDLCLGNSPVTGEFPAQMAITRKMFLFYDVTMKHHGSLSLLWPFGIGYPITTLWQLTNTKHWHNYTVLIKYPWFAIESQIVRTCCFPLLQYWWSFLITSLFSVSG